MKGERGQSTAEVGLLAGLCLMLAVATTGWVKAFRPFAQAQVNAACASSDWNCKTGAYVGPPCPPRALCSWVTPVAR